MRTANKSLDRDNPELGCKSKGKVEIDPTKNKIAALRVGRESAYQLQYQNGWKERDEEDDWR
ncbi:14642_t:CDS:2 [Entrophospora sp. SA101]|nr:14451_t:CDS:2 [Entrophospora sp. SA101]CAJ0630563.1 14642_t:CDS:2 [Entrophospora sp. SA101]CAJ0897984.1 14003_t:CDS:2 [Entrophospora sp. SA101]